MLFSLMTRLAHLFDVTRFERRPWGTEKLSIRSPRKLRDWADTKLSISCFTAHCDKVSAADRAPIKQIPAMTALGGTPMTGIAGSLPAFTLSWMLRFRLRPRLFKIAHVSN